MITKLTQTKLLEILYIVMSQLDSYFAPYITIDTTPATHYKYLHRKAAKLFLCCKIHQIYNYGVIISIKTITPIFS